MKEQIWQKKRHSLYYNMQQEHILQVMIKCNTIRDLFGQIGKNIRSQRKFFLKISAEGIKMVFSQTGRQTQIEISFYKTMFNTYIFKGQNYSIFRFDIRQFEFLGVFFENSTYAMSFKFYQEGLKVHNDHELIGFQSYEIAAEYFDRQMIPSQLLENEQNQPMREEEKFTKIIIQKTKMLSNILHSLGLLKVQNFQIHLNKEPNMMEITPIRPATGVKNLNYLVPMKILGEAQIQGKLRFSVKRFKSGLSLFDKNTPLHLDLYTNRAEMQSETKEKKDIKIAIATLAQEVND